MLARRRGRTTAAAASRTSRNPAHGQGDPVETVRRVGQLHALHRSLETPALLPAVDGDAGRGAGSRDRRHPPLVLVLPHGGDHRVDCSEGTMSTRSHRRLIGHGCGRDVRLRRVPVLHHHTHARGRPEPARERLSSAPPARSIRGGPHTVAGNMPPEKSSLRRCGHRRGVERRADPQRRSEGAADVDGHVGQAQWGAALSRRDEARSRRRRASPACRRQAGWWSAVRRRNVSSMLRGPERVDAGGPGGCRARPTGDHRGTPARSASRARRRPDGRASPERTARSARPAS